MTPQEKNWVALSLVEGLGAKLTGALVAQFGSVERIFSASADSVARTTGIDRKLARRIAAAKDVQAFQTELRLIEQHGVSLLTLESENYPMPLREIAAPPPILYVKGKFPASQGLHLAVVGTRTSTRYGEKTTRRLISELAEAEPNLTIVSGLARGIDTVAHRHALECGLETIAVLAGGLSGIYPTENEELAEQISSQGALVSEFHMAQPPLAKHFPIRNRIISGLCAGVLVIEAGERSGALITAGFALNHNREVFAVPGNVDGPSARGTNRLIQKGQARLVGSAGDILEEFQGYSRGKYFQMDWLNPDSVPVQSKNSHRLDGDRGRIIGALARGSLHADDLSQELELPVERLLGILLELELTGDIHQTAANLYELS